MKLTTTGLFILLASPLVVWPGFGYDALRLPIVAAGTAMLLFGAKRSTSDRRPHIAWTVAAAAFFGAHLLSIAAAVNIGEALLSMTPVAAGLAVFWAIARGWVARESLFAPLAVVAIVFSGVGLAWNAVSTLGNTNYAGGFAAILACACLGGTISEGALWRRILCGVGAAMGVAEVAVSDSRGAMVGLAAGVAAVAIAMARRRRWAAAAACVLLAAVPAVARISRVRSIFDSRDETARVRLGLWKGTAQMAGAYPIVGCGGGNFQFQFPPFRDAEEFELSNRADPKDFIEAREPHSTPLLVLAETGPLGLAAFLGLLALGVIIALKRMRGADREEAAALTAALGGLAAFAIAGLFNSLHRLSPFDVLSGAMLGTIAASGTKEAAVRRSQVGLRAAGLAASLGLSVVSILAAIGEWNYFAATRKTKDPSGRASLLDASLGAWPWHWTAREELGNLRLKTGDLAGAVVELKRVLEIHPNSVRALNSLAVAIAQSGGSTDDARRLLEKAERLQPSYRMTQHNLGILSLAQGRAAAAEGRIESALLWLLKAKARGIDVGAEAPELRGQAAFAELFSGGR